MPQWFKALSPAMQRWIPSAVKASTGTEVVFFGFVLASAGGGLLTILNTGYGRKVSERKG